MIWLIGTDKNLSLNLDLKKKAAFTLCFWMKLYRHSEWDIATNLKCNGYGFNSHVHHTSYYNQNVVWCKKYIQVKLKYHNM